MSHFKPTHPPLGVGILTIVMILVVLMLACFAVMSLLSANADAKLTDAACENISAYYAADTQAEQTLADVSLALRQSNWQRALLSTGVSMDVGDEAAILYFSIPIDSRDCLLVMLRQPLADNVPTGPYTRIVWQMIPREDATVIPLQFLNDTQ